MNLLNYNYSCKNPLGWEIQEQIFDSRYLGKCESIFAQGNGYLGIRNALEEHYVGEMRNSFVTGSFDRIYENEVTELPNIPDATAITIKINNQRFNLESGTIKKYSRVLNLKNGETFRVVEWIAPDGNEFEFEFRRFVSLHNEHLMANKVTIKSKNAKADIEIDSGIYADVTNSGAQHFHEGLKRVYEGKYLEMISTTMQSKVQIAIHSAHSISKEPIKVLPVIERRNLSNAYDLVIEPNETIVFEKYTVIHSSRDRSYIDVDKDEITQLLHKDGINLIKEVCAKGYEYLLEKSANAWEEYWSYADIKIDSTNPYDQLGVRFALYHLNIMVKGDDNRVGIGAKGMTGEGYKGHSFWDTEMFILPYYIFTNPKVARTLLEYRYFSLPAAKVKAKENGYEGAMYPWESAWLDDGEVTPLYGAADIVTGERTPILTGLLEHHITADIAYAIWQYIQVTNDNDFLTKYGYEIIFETAKFWQSRLEYNEELNRYEINDVIGPDEYKEHVDNNVYTNYMAKYNMQLAIELKQKLYNEDVNKYNELNERLDLDQLEIKINEVIDKIYLPVENEEGIIPQTDQYLSLKKIDLSKYKDSQSVMGIYKDYNVEQINEIMVSKQADLVMLLFLFDDLFDEKVRNKNYIFYESRTLHDSSLSKSTHCIMASDFGMEEQAYKLYQGALNIDLGSNTKTSDLGIHSASMGGIWQSVVMGFAGVRLYQGNLRINPKLPIKWQSLSFNIVWKGSNLKIEITHSQICIKNCSQKDVELKVNGKDCIVVANETSIINI